jgi:hypothetical protein
VRRPSTALPFSVSTNDLQSASDILRDLRQRATSQGMSAERREQLSSIAAFQLRLTEIAPDREQALKLIAQQALKVAKADGTAIATSHGQSVDCCARAGSLAPPLGTAINTRSGLSNECLRNGEVVRCDDTETDTRADVNNCRQAGIRSVLVVPLRRHEKVIGVFAVFSRRRAAFGDWETSLLQLLAALVSPRILDASSGDDGFDQTAPSASLAPMSQIKVPEAEKREPHVTANAIRNGSRPGASSPGPWVSSGKISECLDRIRQDPALRILGRAKAYLTIEALYDGTDRSHAIALCQRLMFLRAAEIGVVL